MKRTQAAVEARRASILAQIRAAGMANVRDLAEHFQVSELTIRRDMDALVQLGKLERFHGGAISTQTPDNDSSVTIQNCKHAIAKRAAELVEDNDTIFINSSSTALLLLKYVTAKNVTIITNNAKALFAVRPSDSILIFTGGEIRVPKEAMVGEFATNNLLRVTASKCFMGCAGVSIERGVMSTVLPEASINEIMVNRTYGAKVLLADYRRFDRVYPFRSCGVEDVTHLISDTSVPPRLVEPIRQLGVTVIQVKPMKKL